MHMKVGRWEVKVDHIEKNNIEIDHKKSISIPKTGSQAVQHQSDNYKLQKITLG